ncbi:MAG TPA: alkaline phosphatase PhoX [Solirubrobacteraceae bacterium]
MKGKRTVALVAVVAGIIACGVAAAKPPKNDDGFQTTVKPYAKGVPSSGWVTEPIFSVGDIVPETGTSNDEYRMVGIPDGLGVEKRGHGKGKRHFHKKKGKGGRTTRVWMTHELTQTDVSEPRVGRPAQRGAFATELRLNRDGEVVSARRAFDTVYQDNTLVGPAADASNTTPAFSRWCSAFLADSRVGFDRPIFFANEETGPAASGPTATFSPKGSQSVAIFDNQAHALSKLGHFPKENTVVMRGTGERTVILTTEDGPRTPDSQLYLYIGRKDRSSRNPLRRNGLDNGKLYVLASDDARDDENQLLQGDTLHVRWAEIPNADQLTDVQTEAAADAAGAFGFVRIEDGAFRPNAKREFWFDTTGDQSGRSEADPHTNELGRLYRLRFDGRNPLKGARLTQAYNADQLTAAQDGPLSPDNLYVTKRFVIINEDGTGGAPGDGTGSRDDIERRNRDGSIWIVPRKSAGDPSTFKRVAELVGRSEGGRDGVKTTSGIWETSGIVAFGNDSFLFDVQAHAPTAPPGGKPITVEDGQLLVLRRDR